MFSFYIIHKFAGFSISISSSDENFNLDKKVKSKKRTSIDTMSQVNKIKNKNKSNNNNKSNDDIKIVQYRGIRSLFAIRAARRDALKGQKIPLLNIVYTTAFLQVFIVICITTIITLRKETEYFFLNTKQTFDGIFRIDDDLDTNLLRAGNIINALHDKFTIFFNLRKEYSDHFIYPDDILIENTTSNNHHHHNTIPSATLTFNFKDYFMDQQSMSYNLNPTNYSILSDNTSDELVSLIQNSHNINANFEIESYSFVNDVRNLWKWNIDYHVTFKQTSNRLLTDIEYTYDRIDTSVSWWNKDSTAFMGSVIASFGLCAFSIMALTRFAYKYGFCFMFNRHALTKIIQFRIVLPISHLISLTCGLIYLINLSNIADLNDAWQLRLTLAFCAWLSWTMLVFSISTQGTEYGALFKTLKISFKPIVILIISLFPIAIGFILFGSLLFGIPNGEKKFTSPEITAKTLYAVWLGDEVLDTFYAAGVGNIIAEIYMYSWGILFIAIIFNVGLAIVESNFFETIPQLEIPDDKVQDQQIIDSKNAASSSSDTGHDDSSESEDETDQDEINNISKNTEWGLNKPDAFKSDLYIFSNIQSSFEYVPPKSGISKNKEAIKLNTVIKRKRGKSKEKDIFLYGDQDDESSNPSQDNHLDDKEMKTRNNKYINSFVSHLKHQVVNKISEGLIDRNVRNLLNKYSVESQSEIDKIQPEIVRHYQDYLTNVRKELSLYQKLNK